MIGCGGDRKGHYSTAVLTRVRLGPVSLPEWVELSVLAWGLSPGIGESGAGAGLGGRCPTLVTSWVFLSGLQCPSLQGQL